MLVLSATLGLYAQQDTGTPELNTNHIPDSAFAGFTIFPQQFKNDKQFEMLPYEVMTAWGKRELGIDPMEASQITMIVKAPKDLDTFEQQPPSWAAIMHFKSQQKLDGDLLDQLDKDPNGKVYHGDNRAGIPSALLLDDKTVVLGDDAWFDELEKAGADSSLGKLMKTEMAGGGDFVALLDIEKIRPVLNQMMEQMPPGLPPAVKRLKELPELLDSKVVRLDLKSGQMMVEMNGVDAASAERTKKILTKAMSLGADMAVGGVATQMDGRDKVQAAALEYFERLSGIIQRDLEPKLDGNKVVVEVKNMNMMVVPTLVGMILPAVQAARQAARRTVSMNNLKQMALACHNYESGHQRFPPQANYDDDGKALLSWRVHILPFIEEGELYDQFHLDEPWDSDHNKKLIAQMPAAYDCPTVSVEQGKTIYLGIAGEGGIFSKKGTDLGQITDGMSNTAMIVEVNPASAVEWTKPQDYERDQNNPLKGLGAAQMGGFNVACADGSVHFISGSLDPEIWKNIAQMDDGNVVQGF
ncbi:DUF1559 domain-containing protein [Mariniblastus sp.]|nr:DUF1559 domain-containing protein [Mariniblastus sp.]